MKLTVINSNSAGNAYILHNDKEALLIECGVRYDKIKQALGYNLTKVSGAIITHEHQDHCKSVDLLLYSGITVWASLGTHIAMGTEKHHRSKVATAGTMFRCGGFLLKPFEIKHDAAEPFGYLINHTETGNVLFLTDSYYSEYTFKGLHNIIVEANYCQSIIDERLMAGTNPKYLRDRVLESHMSLGTCKELLQANDLSQVNNIVLIHLSDSNSDAAKFKREVEEVTGKTVWIAEAGLTIPFNKTPF
jgi:phosphoribosyl 1,2-cyclic phosphodiesterase